MRHIVFLPAALAALALVPAAAAVGPSLPAVNGGAGITSAAGDVNYVTRLGDPTSLGKASTRIVERSQGTVLRTADVDGSWGIQLATLDGALAGLSPDGRVLALSDNVRPDGNLRTRSRFAIVDTHTLAITRTITLSGDFSVDALSPKAGMLYLIHHVSRKDATKYQVKAYDLNAGRLLPGVIADKSQAGWIMAGYPIARATSADGGWVYTLYRQDSNYPFVHALDTVHGRAVCVGVPANWTTENRWISGAKLELAAGKLAIKTQNDETRFLLDTQTFRISNP